MAAFRIIDFRYSYAAGDTHVVLAGRHPHPMQLVLQDLGYGGISCDQSHRPVCAVVVRRGMWLCRLVWGPATNLAGATGTCGGAGRLVQNVWCHIMVV